MGGRSRSAANLLSNHGIDAASMSGGIDAWNGLVSKAEVDQGIYLIEGSESLEEVIALAYGLEGATERFYRKLAKGSADPEIRDGFEKLALDEIRHQQGLWDHYQELSGEHPDRETFEAETVSEVLENGKTAEQALAEYPDWTGHPQKALELAMSLETDSLDLYLRMARIGRRDDVSRLFHSLADEEKRHLRALGELFRRKAVA